MEAFKLIKKKRELFQEFIAPSLESSTALPLQFPVSWCWNVGPTSLSAVPEEQLEPQKRVLEG
jgi:hypothetical protein